MYEFIIRNIVNPTVMSSGIDYKLSWFGHSLIIIGILLWPKLKKFLNRSNNGG